MNVEGATNRSRKYRDHSSYRQENNTRIAGTALMDSAKLKSVRAKTDYTDKIVDKFGAISSKHTKLAAVRPKMFLV